jgi:hypothetical protein
MGPIAPPVTVPLGLVAPGHIVDANEITVHPAQRLDRLHKMPEFADDSRRQFDGLL